MQAVERWVSRVVLGAITPVALMLAGWWGSLGLLGDSPWIPWATLAGLAIGLVLDLTLLRRWLAGLYRLSRPALTAVAIFYSVMIYGFFMGLPIANLLVGAGWGFAVGRRHVGEDVRAGQPRNDVVYAASAAATIMFVLCCTTAWIALREPTIGWEMRGMLGLSFTPSWGEMSAVAVLGGFGLVVLGYSVTASVAGWAARFEQTRGAARR
jgi:hypothetical protein